MNFLTGIFVVDAPASALNNRGTVSMAGHTNVSLTKTIRTDALIFPYVSAQALRYWIRMTIPVGDSWQNSPVFRDAKIAFSDANPILYADDDLFGYMRAESKKADAGKQESQSRTPTSAEITRVSPFRVGPLVAINPVTPTRDYGTMTRSFEGDPVPHEHEFYRAVLRAPFSLNLQTAGVFSYSDRSGFRNLDQARIELAKKRNLEHSADAKTYALSLQVRAKRCATLLRTLGVIDGGAKQALHYTDTTPTIAAFAVFEGGNNPLYYLFGSDGEGGARLRSEVLDEVSSVWKDRIRSSLYIGWRHGFCDHERERMRLKLEQMHFEHDVVFDHPREAFSRAARDLEQNAAEWLR
jgi:CRISPR-associated protein Cst2